MNFRTIIAYLRLLTPFRGGVHGLDPADYPDDGIPPNVRALRAQLIVWSIIILFWIIVVIAWVIINFDSIVFNRPPDGLHWGDEP